MLRTTLVLVRHAACEGGHGSNARLCGGGYDAPLTPLGHAQVEFLRLRLAVEPPVSAVYASPLRRTTDTAKAASGLLAQLSPSLREIDCGSLEGQLLTEIQTKHPELWERNLAQSDEAFRWIDGETCRDFRERVLTAIRAIAVRHAGERVLVFTHAGVISQLAGTLNGISPARWEPFRPGNASITEIDWGRDSGMLRSFDDRAHLK